MVCVVVDGFEAVVAAGFDVGEEVMGAGEVGGFLAEGDGEAAGGVAVVAGLGAHGGVLGGVEAERRGVFLEPAEVLFVAFWDGVGVDFGDGEAVGEEEAGEAEGEGGEGEVEGDGAYF